MSHYKKDGSLDMRYSSSKAAVSSGSYSSGGGGSSGYGGNSTSYGQGSSMSTSRSDSLHYKKDGSLDMRYSSSKASSSSAQGFSSLSSGSETHYKKDGTPDMRYASSKAAVSSSLFRPLQGQSSEDFHYKKDGTLDMRYSSSQQAAGSNPNIHVKKDGTPDMRFKTSKQLTAGIGQLRISSFSGIPLTKAGLPDMRTKAAKEWVGNEGKKSGGNIPDWIPRQKDGRPDMSKAIVAEFLAVRGVSNVPSFDHTVRQRYYEDKMKNQFSDFKKLVDRARREPVALVEPTMHPQTDTLRREILYSSRSPVGDSGLQIPKSIPEVDYHQLKSTFGDEEKNLLGKGSFGVVLKGTWGGRTVAVKRLHLNQLTRKEKMTFMKELNIMAHLGRHPNLVTLHAYTLDPPCFVMEFVKLGSLSYVLHYCEDPAIEAKITCGDMKKRLIQGIVNGMCQLHTVGVVHGDLKPANVLVDEKFTAKVTDFGLSTLRGKTSSSLASANDGENIIGGTGGYMAPELLDSSSPPEFSSDVYSFGILLNEVAGEEEPYADKMQNFLGRGPFAAVNYAKLGNRPFINARTPNGIVLLIKQCWDAKPRNRPTFDGIQAELQVYKIPNSF